MAERSPNERLAITLELPPDVARRLMLAAEAQKRPVADVAINLLDRHLPRPQSGEAKKASIPYS